MANKRCINCITSIISVDTMIEELDEFDVMFRKRLDYSQVYEDADNYKTVIDANLSFYYAGLIGILNGIPLELIFKSDRGCMVCAPIGIQHASFRNLSALEWNEKNTYETDSLIFRCRFVSLLLEKVMPKQLKVSERIAKRNRKHQEICSEKEILFMVDITKKYLLFTKLLVSLNKDFRNVMLKIHEYSSFLNKDIEHYQIKNLLLTSVFNLRRGLEEDGFTNRVFLDDDLAIYEILKIAYILATNDTNFKVLPKFKYIEGATVEHDLLLLIENLGLEIQQRTNGSYSLLFQNFITASPKIHSDYYKESMMSKVITLGIFALSFVDFFCDTFEIHQFIREMLKRGI